MITEWTLGNFKSIADKVKLPLAPLTLICGANSSGKSTIIQSMLMIAQTLSSPATQRPLVINGELVKLGYLSDIFHNGSDLNPITIGFDLSLTDTIPGTIREPRVFTDLPQRVSVLSEFSSPENASNTNLKVKFLTTWFNADQQYVRIVATEANQIEKDLRQRGYSVPPDLQAEIANGRFNYRHEELLLESKYPNNRTLRPTGYCSLRHFLPDNMVVQYNAAEEKISDIIRRVTFIISDVKPDLDLIPSIEFQSPIGMVLLDLLGKTIYNLRRKTRNSAEQSIHELSLAESRLDKKKNLREWVSIVCDQVSTPNRRRLSVELSMTLERLRFDLPVSLKEQGWRLRPFPNEISHAVTMVTDFFETRVKYLGPLRDDPKMIFGLPPIPESRDVGIKGEFTAAVLERYGRETKVDCPMPPRNSTFLPETKRMLLIDAVVMWLQYMELVDHIHTTDHGKMGVGLSLQTSGLNRELDLTNVGVGVSQVLPILTMCLLTPKGGLVLLEQPELHLHPKVQSILGDFLLGIVSRGTQCIVETHSDRLINRVRRRIAEAERDSLMKLVRIYFAEKELSKTKIIPVEPNEFGAIPNWPKGFFDEAADESEMIIEAASRKRQLILEQKRMHVTKRGGDKR